MDDAQPMVLERDPKADSLTNVRPDQLLDFDSATVVAAALARLCPQAAASSKSEADCLLRDARKLYEGNMRYFRTLKGIKYSNKTQPKGRDSHVSIIVESGRVPMCEHILQQVQIDVISKGLVN